MNNHHHHQHKKSWYLLSIYYKQKIEWSHLWAVTHLFLIVTLFEINIIICNLQESQLRLETTDVESLRAGIWTQPCLSLVIITEQLLIEKIK